MKSALPKMEFRRCHTVVFIPTMLVLLPHLTDSATFNINCAFSGQNSGLLPLGNYFPLDIVLGHPQNASIMIHSPCCGDVVMSHASCQECTSHGDQECFSDSEYVSLDYANETNGSCKASTAIEIKCIAIKCQVKRNSTGKLTETFVSPGEVTECVDGSQDICTDNGTWIQQTCENDTSTVTPNTTDAVTGVTETPPGIGGNATFFNDTAEALFNEEEALKDLRTFLIVLGVVLVGVVVLVCACFFRKKKTPFPTDHSLEYWHDMEYIDGVMDKGVYSKHPFSTNPIYSSDKSRTSGKQSGRERERTLRNQGVGSSDAAKCEVPGKMKHDYAEKYVATAAGSNFYSYRKSPEMDITDIDHVIDDYNDNGDNSPSIPRGTKIYPESSFKPSRTGKKSRRSTGSARRSGVEDIDRDEVAHITEGGEIYAMSYKNKLRKKLQECSAEESDV